MTRTDAPTLELLLQHQSLVRSIARDLLVDPHAADDIVQQTWLAALRHAATGAQVGRSLLARIATNLAFNRRRDTRRRETRERRAAVAEPLPSVAELAEREDERRRVVEAVFALKEPLRETVLRRYLDDRSESDVAAMLGIPLGTVRSRLRLARTLLRERLERGDAPRSARALVALAGWSADEAAAAIAGGKGVVLMGAKAWIGAAAGVALLSWIGVVAWRSTKSLESSSDTAVVAAKPDATASVSAAANDGDAAATVAERSPTAPEPAIALSSPAVRIATIRGRCVTPERSPIAGAVVSSPDFPQTTISDATGRFEVAAQIGERNPVSVVAAASMRARTTKSIFVEPHGTTQLGEVVMPIAGAIQGRVLDESDRPVAATIERWPGAMYTDIGWEFGMPSGNPAVRKGDLEFLAHADAAGRFAFEGLTDSWCSLVGIHSDFICVSPIPVAVTGGATTEVVIRMRAARDTEHIRGRVLDADGQPCAGAKIGHTYRLPRSGSSNSHSETLTTDAVGTFACLAAAGSENDFTFIATADAGPEPPLFVFKTVPEHLAEAHGIHGGDPEVILRLAKAPRATIRVVDAEDGSPCANVSVVATATDRSVARYAGTDAAGRASFLVPNCEFGIAIRSARHASVQVGPFVGGADPALDPIRLTRKPSLHGVVAGCDPDRAAGAQVFVYVVEVGTPVMERAGFPLVHAGQYMHAPVGADGSFDVVLDPINPATKRAFARVKVDGFAAAQVDLPLPNPLVASPITLRVTAGGSIEGHVVTPASSSPAGLVVFAGNDDFDFVTTRVEEDGSYRLAHLPPGRWRVAVAADDPPDSLNNTGRTFAPPELEVGEGRVTRFDLSWLPAGIIALNGTVRFGGAALRGSSVWLHTEMLRGPTGVGLLDRSRFARTDVRPSGLFDLEVGVPGTYTFEVSAPADGEFIRFEQSIELVSGSNHFALDLPCGIVNGRCAKPSADEVRLQGDRSDGAKISITTKCAPDGSFTLSVVPAGHFEITVGANSKQIEVRSGETTTVELK